MAEVPSTFVLKPGDLAPDFTLPNGSGKLVSLSDQLGKKGTLVAFVCNHCPFVIHLAKELGELAGDVAQLGVSTVAISSNDVQNYPQDSPEKMILFATQNGWEFPYLYDESQSVAHSYSAACTPDFFLLDGEGKLFYAGQFDSSRPNNSVDVDGSDLRSAVAALVAGEAAPANTMPATGCNIKWKAGNEPAYFG